MKNYIRFAVVIALCAGLFACQSSSKKNEKQEPYRKKIYLTEQDYLDDLDKNAQAERRQAKPNVESEYIFNVQPETQKNVYFFDERVRPLIPGEPSEREYKNTKRLWKKPKRYTPEQYYGDDTAAPAAQDAPSAQPASSYSGYSDDEGDFDYD